MKKISVIIPCYNVSRWIDRCLTSIIRQTMGMEALEVICIDDASEDNTWERLQEWERKFPENILLIRQEVNRRQGTARNLGLQYASADWIAFVDADDWLESDYFEQLYFPAVEFACDAVCCGSMRDYSDTLQYFEKDSRNIEGKESRLVLAETEAVKKRLLQTRGTTTGAWAVLVRRNLLMEHAVYFPEDLVYEDRFWPPLLYIYAERFYFVEVRLYHYFSNLHSTVYADRNDHLVDWMTIQLIKWREYRERGFLEKYYAELEYDILCDAVKIMTLICRQETPSYSLYRLERQIITEWVADYKKNLYISEFQESSRCMLEALYSPLDKEGFRQFHQTVKQMRMILKELQNASGQNLRIVMFYSETESFNFFTDQLAGELQKRGHEVFICDLEDLEDKTEHSYSRLNQFISEKVDLVICFDGLGTREDQFIRQWNRHRAVVIDILMDPPLRFHPTLEKHPDQYQLFCCDREHVEYVKKYFGQEVPMVDFMPHVGTLPDRDIPVIPYEKRRYDILFSGSYAEPDVYLQKTDELFPDNGEIRRMYLQVYDTLRKDSSLTIEAAVTGTLDKLGYLVSGSMLKTLLNRSLHIDWAIRMYHRGRVVETLAKAGLELYLLGQGWEQHPSVTYPNVHWIEGQVPYVKTLDYMADAKINLNVMPWFKAGTHDRIFNTLLQHSLPLTDSSRWLAEHFTDGKDIVLYDLDHLERLPEIVPGLLADSLRAEEMIQRGYEKVSREYTWANCADWILKTAEAFRRKECRNENSIY